MKSLLQTICGSCLGAICAVSCNGMGICAMQRSAIFALRVVTAERRRLAFAIVICNAARSVMRLLSDFGGVARKRWHRKTPVFIGLMLVCSLLKKNFAHNLLLFSCDRARKRTCAK